MLQTGDKIPSVQMKMQLQCRLIIRGSLAPTPSGDALSHSELSAQLKRRNFLERNHPIHPL